MCVCPGTSREILDKAAYWFAVGFYKALVREQSIETCYKWGCNAVQVNMPDVDIVAHVSERSRKLEVVEQGGSPVVSEPLRIVLKQKSPQVEATQVSSDIPSDFREEVFQEAEIQEYKNTTRKTWDEFGQFNPVAREPITQNEYHQRKTLLNKVKDFWIEGFLKPSLYADTAIKLDLKTRPDAVLRPFEGLEVLPVELDESFAELKQTDIYSQIGDGKTLLILGDPGSGKTITLLQLAEKLVNQTEQDLSKPIPVVFNLSSWGQKQQPIEKWLMEEFKDKYQVPKTWSEPWLEQEQLILLFDGLDEVRAEQRNACVRALNKFIATHNLTEIVVCSRVKDYEALSERLQLSSALCIKPLSSKQVYSFLDKAGDSLKGLKTLLQQDIELEKFAQTPLILNVMVWAYQDWSAEKLLQQFRTSENRYRHLFDSYIHRMLNRRVIGQSETTKNSALSPRESFTLAQLVGKNDGQ
ncbi:MAG: NACHT domain-containing protein [Cyanobacteria bacterium P01_F01_bin.143]